MLQRPEHAREILYNGDEEPRRPTAGPRGMDIHDIFAFLKSFWRIIAVWTIAAVTVALAYVFTATPLYTATADLRLDSRKIQVAKNNEQVVGDNSLDSTQLESEVEVLRSDSIALAVVKDLKLADDPEFVDTKPGLFSLIFGGATFHPAGEDLRNRIAVGSLKGNLTIRRVGLTYVVEVSFRSPDREKAARIANAVALAYVTDQLNVKYDSARRAGDWLQQRIAELRDQSNTAAQAVEKYKEKNNIVDTGPRGGLLSDLQVQELNSQMITATAATAEAKARLDRVDQVLKSPAPGEAVGTVTDTLHNEVITKLRQRYLEDREHVARWTEKMGPQHLAVINLQQEMKEVQNSIVDELQRIAQTYKSDYEIAKAREDSLRASLGKQIRESGTSGRAQVDLKELQAASQTYHTIFENFLQKYTEAVQEQSFPISDARVITLATPPFGKSWPKTKLIALLGLLVGVGGGLGHSLVLRNSDRTLRRPRDVEERLRLECIGLLPLIATGEPPKKQLNEVTSNRDGDLPKKILGDVPKLVAPGRPVAGSKPRARLDLTHKVANDPFSLFSERVRSVKIALDSVAQIRPLQCIGVISALPGEGKSTVAVNLANVLARGGRSTLLIDADLRNPQLTRRLGEDAKCGLLELMAGSVQLTEATRMVSDSTLCFLPAIMRRPIANSGDLLASERMRAVLTAARHGFDHVIIDLPPLGPISDSRAIAPLVDSFILVVNWGRTRCEVVEEALANFGMAADKIVGVVLNRVDFRELDAHSHGYYYNKQYARYGYVQSKG